MEGNSKNILLKTPTKFPLLLFKTEKFDKWFSSLCYQSSEWHFYFKFPRFRPFFLLTGSARKGRLMSWLRKESRITRKKPAPVPLGPPQVSHRINLNHLWQFSSYPHRTKSVSTTKPSWSSLLREIITVECKSDTKHTSSLCGKYNRVLKCCGRRYVWLPRCSGQLKTFVQQLRS